MRAASGGPTSLLPTPAILAIRPVPLCIGNSQIVRNMKGVFDV